MDVDLIVPVHNQFEALERNIPRLYGYLKDAFPYRWKLVLVDHGSTDGGFWTARKLEERYPGILALQVALPGRGRALKKASQGLGDVFCCLDAERLPADLEDITRLARLVADDRCDIAAGCRQSPAIAWDGRFASGLFHLGLRLALNLPVSDAQCAFKALSRRVAVELVPLVQDEGWFFDTELLAVAQARGCRIRQIGIASVRAETGALEEPLPDLMRRILDLRRRLRAAAPHSSGRGVTR
jgi:glycosyltransferase involved in cell wall biosynthesis